MKTAEETVPSSRLTWQIAAAAHAVADAAAGLSAAESDPPLIEALLADQYREAGVVPLSPRAFALLTADLDGKGWLRLAVIVEALTREGLHLALAAASRRISVREQVERGMVGPAKALQAVDLRMLASCPVRAEELARRVAAGLGIGIEGETRADSAARLRQIDYTRLLANVEAHRQAAEERVRRDAQKDEAELAAMLEAFLRPWKVLPSLGTPSAAAAPRAMAGLPACAAREHRHRARAPRRLVDEAAAWAEKQVTKLLKCQEAQDERIGRRRKKGGS